MRAESVAQSQWWPVIDSKMTFNMLNCCRALITCISPGLTIVPNKMNIKFMCCETVKTCLLILWAPLFTASVMCVCVCVFEREFELDRTDLGSPGGMFHFKVLREDQTDSQIFKEGSIIRV